MSSRCKCRFSEHADTILGSHRDPISSEKCWLDFAVRELSRVAAGKARGQEAVWRSQCKPAWWDCVCPHPWKNPTANPKDSKDTLKAKFECLVQHLRNKGQIPRELNEEVDRWEKGQVQELFLMTSFSCMLGQASNLHSILDDTCRKMEDTGISVDHNILEDLESCLSACVEKINSMKDNAQKTKKSHAGCSDTTGASCSGQKRPHDKSDAGDISPLSKRSKLSSPSPHLTSTAVSPSSSASPSSSHSPFTVQSVSSTTLDHERQKPIDEATLQKLLHQLSKRTTATPPPAQSQGRIVQIKSACLPRPRQPSQKKQTPVLSSGSLAAITSVPLTSLSAQSSSLPISETTEFGDFLEMDFVSNDDITVNDCEFLDKLLEEKSPYVTPSSSENTGLGSTFQMPAEDQSLPVQNQPLNVSSPDPLLSHNSVAACIPQNLSAPVQIPLDTGADRLDCWGADTVVEDLGIALSPDARDKVLGETETVSDSDYETSSPISHRSSLDVDPYSNADLSSPDLEALLDAFS